MIATERDIAWMVERIIAVDNPDRIYLFGSQAKGTASSHSDIDLLIVGPSKEIPQRRDKQIVAALRGFPARFDLLCFTPGEIAEELKDPVSFVSAALASARVIYDRRAPRASVSSPSEGARYGVAGGRVAGSVA